MTLDKKKIHEIRNYILDEIKDNDLISEKHKKMYRSLNYIGHFLVFVSSVSSRISISAFASLAGVLADLRVLQ